ncbi:hypothetical protein CEXT_697501 [Caerostris extrusa]|uniref:Uncharacterized protein n=1 Tax=Caerostris extrusa TaxID=172846 RepID=A0AAV4Y3V4_CAEEX|nr:hypothetical protein CEXT_697501 [Caerostris extrusa]
MAEEYSRTEGRRGHALDTAAKRSMGVLKRREGEAACDILVLKLNAAISRARGGCEVPSCQRFLLIRKESARRGGIKAKGKWADCANCREGFNESRLLCGKLLSRALSGSVARLERGETSRHVGKPFSPNI